MVQSVQLVTSGGQIVIGQIVPMEQRHLDELQELWHPILAETNQPDAGWIWDYKLRQSQQQDRYEAYSLDVDVFSQGVMFFETQWHRSQLAEHRPLVYVEAISSAPWNRVAIEQPPWLRGVGRRLLTFARLRSVELGYGGRVGLHSLPNVEGFYERLKMTDYGPDPEKDDLIYFEYGVI
ncbi:GNAT family N-acetyltransferase [Leptolyngbya ectocarpi]|uniref:GNAT family N-acetyltransferase n=1 Tax=Leptolyngbya ectocarpi TaxID=1202 RepID=UPI001D139458|nr:GNAT family N-acetyltransferase [Leptolyngbya ectocarpi]